MENRIRQFGFSLVELSVVLTVIGITLSGALVIATKKTESDKIAETNFKLDKIEQALELFLIGPKRLPCPANGTYEASTNASFGLEGSPSEAGGVGVCSLHNFRNGSIHSGVVPVKTLSLPDEFMFDAWGRRIVYVVDARFANSTTTNPSCNGGSLSGEKTCFKYQKTGSIRVDDPFGNPRTNEALYVLFSNGKNGNGAWKNIGSPTRLAASADADELENAGDDEGAFDRVFVQKDPTTTFDDILRYRTKWQLLYDARVITDYDLCVSAEDKTNLCSGSKNSLICESLANWINDWCLDM